MNLELLSKAVSHALRHEPWCYELEIDEEGWAPIEELLHALRKERPEWRLLVEAHLVQMIEHSAKKRHELKNGKIRALYGHSIAGKLLKQPARPPAVLYHGTGRDATKLFQEKGLQPMGRQYVHLSVDHGVALQVGKRKDQQPVILTIRAGEAYERSVTFYRGNDHVWLADEVPPQFIDTPA